MKKRERSNTTPRELRTQGTPRDYPYTTLGAVVEEQPKGRDLQSRTVGGGPTPMVHRLTGAKSAPPQPPYGGDTLLAGCKPSRVSKLYRVGEMSDTQEVRCHNCKWIARP